MASDTAALLAEAKGLDLFTPHGAFEVHCAHCHARLDGNGDCATCGLIGRPATELERRAATDPERVGTLLTAAIAKRRGYTPAGRASAR
ncbi:MAG TPA: hypothetical protein VIN69_10535 [Candidatus Limnocylindria bacterium]|jgi:cytochrome c peroxidase